MTQPYSPFADLDEAARRLHAALDRLASGLARAGSHLPADTADLQAQLADAKAREAALEAAVWEAREALAASIDDIKTALGPV